MTQELPINWPDDGLIPAVIQEAASGDVLMVGYMNDRALERTRSSGLVHFWSRSRQKLWKKGETSGHLQHVRNIFVNCDQNSLLIEVQQDGAVCHDGYPTCFYRRLEADNTFVTVRDREFDPTHVYAAPKDAAAVTRRWWGAYEFLRDTNQEDRSGTSRAIRNQDSSVVSRIQDELHELAGVLDGTHVHTNQVDDATLEASQVCYWTAVEAIRTYLGWADIRPDRALDFPSDEPAGDSQTVARLLRGKASQLTEVDFTPTIAHDILLLVGSACRVLGVDPLTPIRADLTELESRSYLSPYFAR